MKQHKGLKREQHKCRGFNRKGLQRLLILFLCLFLLFSGGLKVLPVAEIDLAPLQHGLNGWKDMDEQIVAGQTNAHYKASLKRYCKDLVIYPNLQVSIINSLGVKRLKPED